MEEKTEEYIQGFDAGRYGANERNCNFRLFSTPEKTKEWERGNRDGFNQKVIAEKIPI